MVMSILHRKEQLILTTIDIIDELGIQKLTTREIARRQDISEATLFRHFKNKNELLVAVLDYFVQFDNDILQSAKITNLGPKEALIYFVSSYAEYYENYPAITTILQVFDNLLYEEDLVDKVKDILKARTSMIEQYIEKGKEIGVFLRDLDSLMMAVMIIGFIKEICFQWRVQQCVFSLKDKMVSTLELLLESLEEKDRLHK